MTLIQIHQVLHMNPASRINPVKFFFGLRSRLEQYWREEAITCDLVYHRDAVVSWVIGNVCALELGNRPKGF
jgi:hypothetical protein